MSQNAVGEEEQGAAFLQFHDRTSCVTSIQSQSVIANSSTVNLGYVRTYIINHHPPPSGSYGPPSSGSYGPPLSGSYGPAVMFLHHQGVTGLHYQAVTGLHHQAVMVHHHQAVMDLLIHTSFSNTLPMLDNHMC